MVRVMHSVSIMNRAGQETFIMNVYRKIDKSRVQFDFQCSVKGNGDFDEEIQGLGGRLFYLGDNPIKLPFVKYFGDVLLQYNFFKRHKGYDVFHIHTYHAFNAWLSIIGAKMAGVKKIVLHSHNTHGMHPELHRLFRKMLSVMKIERYACSEMAAEWMFGRKALQSGKVKIIKNGIVPEEFQFSENGRNQKRQELKLQDRTVIGHIGRFNQQKNHTFLIDVFYEYSKICQNAVLLLIGEGELKEEIMKKAEQKGLREKVFFLGVRTDIRELLWAMDLFLFPSLYEGLSVVAIEAQATGVPILAADTLTPETKITECIQFFSLKEKASIWAEKIGRMVKKGHTNTTSEITTAGYNIEETVKILIEDYCK